MAATVLAFVNSQQPVVQPDTGLATVSWLAWFASVQASVNALNVLLTASQASMAVLQASVAALTPGTGTGGGTGLTVYPLGGGDIATVSNPSAVWMTVRNASRVRITWSAWTGQVVSAYLQVHSEDNAVPATARVVAVDADGTVTRVVGTGTATASTGTHASGWSPLELVPFSHGTGVEDLVLQVIASTPGFEVSATGMIEAGAATLLMDSASERASVLGRSIVPMTILPLPTGTVDAEAREQLAGRYTGIPAKTP